MLKDLSTLGDLRGKGVLVRCNFDVEGDVIQPAEAWRIDESIPFLQELCDRGARIIVLSHRGRPEGVEKQLSLRPVFEYVKQKLPGLKYFDTGTPQEGEMMLLENLRFDSRESANDETFARALAARGDVYINNDFATAHRAHASIVGVAKLLPSAAGPLLIKEVTALDEVKNFKELGLVFLMGGAKSETKLKLVGKFLSRSDAILLGGVLANTLLQKRGYQLGKSTIDGESDLSSININNQKLVLPVDVVVSRTVERPENVKVVRIEEIVGDEYIVDIGPETQALFQDKMKNARLIVWNGPVGISEVPEFGEGSRAILQVLQRSSARKIGGGGDTISFLSREHALTTFDFISTGGGAMLAYLAGETLPGLDVLQT